MRREVRRKNIKKGNEKAITYSAIGVMALIIVAIAGISYTNNKKQSNKYANLESKKINNIANMTSMEDTESASTQMGKTIEESEQEKNVTNTANTINENETTNQTTNTTKETNYTNTTHNATTKTDTTTKSENSNKKQELSFMKPVEGDILKEYAKEQLLYSNTLEEWTTHLGIDIKAEETSVVVAAETGTVKSIKNDPRYGITIVIEHENGYQTVYSNLLTSEFVVEGEKVEKGQTIATIGKTAAFEAKDEAHLHFEILKDFTQVDPTIYIDNDT